MQNYANQAYEYDSEELRYEAEHCRDKDGANRRARRPEYSRAAGRRRSSVGGIHRRRNKRWSW